VADIDRLLDALRFLAHATIVQVTGKSYRLRQRAGTTDD